ncbi:MAG TPA: sterol desaturase family protein [Leucothrix mucor]|nr:sterol desaturase family protein [Leucothrix mucor]
MFPSHNMDMLELRFSEVANLLEMIDIFGLIIISFAFIGIAYDALKKKQRSYKEASANIIIGITNGLLNMTFYGLIFVITLWFAEQVAFNDIPVNLWTWVMAIIAADFSYYWMHRIEHKVRFFWTIHSVHHSSTEFDLTTGLRLAWLEGLIEWIFFVPMILVGFDMVQAIASILIVVAYQAWIHTEHIGKLGYLDHVLNTPSVHRVHHGSNPHYIDKNFGGILMIWDKLFGSYQAEQEIVIYGLTKNIGTTNPITINFYEWISLIKDLQKTKSIKEKWALISRPP